MVDAWPRVVGALNGTAQVPVLCWPVSRIHVIIARGPDDEPDLELPPEPPAPRIEPQDELIADYITQAAGISVRAAAAHLGLTKSMVSRSLVRMRELGRIEFDRDDGWLAR